MASPTSRYDFTGEEVFQLASCTDQAELLCYLSSGNTRDFFVYVDKPPGIIQQPFNEDSYEQFSAPTRAPEPGHHPEPNAEAPGVYFKQFRMQTRISSHHVGHRNEASLE